MKRIIASLCLLVLCAPSHAQTDLIDLYMSRMAQSKRFTGTVLLAKGDSIIYHKAFGPADATNNKPNTTESVYRIGSVTKTFTAALLMQMVEEGRLTLNDPLSNYFRLFPRCEEVTIRQLLSHTSGIPGYTEQPDIDEWKYDYISPFDLALKVKDLPFLFEPGERFAYSNTNYVLLGIALEELLTDTYEAMLTRRILTPLGMTQTGMDLGRKNLKLSAGLTPSRDGYVAEEQVHTSVAWSAGAMYSTPSDLLKFSIALHSGRLYRSEATLTEMTTPVTDTYALGIYHNTMAGMAGIGHNGGIDGYAAQWLFFPEGNLHLITLSNCMTSDHAAVGESLLNWYKGEPIEIPEERKVIFVAEEVLSKYVGSYELMPDFLIDITLVNGGLKAKGTGQKAFELYAQSEKRFYAMVADVEIEFNMGEGPEAESIWLTQMGQRLLAKRFAIKDLSIKVPVAKLKRLIGVYELQPGFDLAVSLDGDKLMAQATGQSPFELYAESDTRFFATVAPVDLEFEIGENGLASGFTLSQSGHVMKAERKEE